MKLQSCARVGREGFMEKKKLQVRGQCYSNYQKNERRLLTTYIIII